MLQRSEVERIADKALHRFVVEKDNRLAFRSLLTELIDITNSAYGFIGEVHRDAGGNRYLQIHAYTDIAWDHATRQLLLQSEQSGLRFTNLDTLFGAVITSEQVVISNAPATDERSGGLPPGHPPLNAFLGCPLRFGDEITGMVGLANRDGGYSQEIVDALEPALQTCGVMIYARVTGQERESMRRRAEEARRLESLVTLAGNLAHDLNNWLTVIMSTVEASRMTSDAANPQSLDIIFKAAKQAAQLSHRMLVYSGTTSTGKSRINVCELAKNTLETMKSLAPAAIEFEFEADRKHLDVMGDSTSLSQAFSNLISNSFEALNDTKQPKLRMKIWQAAGAPVVHIEVSDNGHGIPEESLAHILEPYYSTRGQGRGFGLAIVDGIARAHGGSLQVDSDVGAGTCVTLRIPLLDARDNSPATTNIKPSTQLHISDPILIVDDDEVVLSAVAEMFEANELTTVTADSGDAALKLLHEITYSAVVLDLSMPDMNGIEVLRELRKTHPDLPVLLVSGFTSERVPDALLNDPHTDFLRKPFRMPQIIAALSDLGCG